MAKRRKSIREIREANKSRGKAAFLASRPTFNTNTVDKEIARRKGYDVGAGAVKKIARKPKTANVQGLLMSLKERKKTKRTLRTRVPRKGIGGFNIR